MSSGGRLFKHRGCIVLDWLHLRIARRSGIIENTVPKADGMTAKTYGGETGESKTSAVSLLDVADVSGCL